MIKFLPVFEFGQMKTTEGNCLYFKDEWLQSYLVSWTIFHMSWFHWRHLIWCFPFYYDWWHCKRNIIHVRKVIHTHFLKVWVIMEASEDGSNFQLSSTDYGRQKVIQGTLSYSHICIFIAINAYIKKRRKISNQ